MDLAIVSSPYALAKLCYPPSISADLIGIATRLIALVQAFDTVAADEESLNLAQEKFKDLLEVGPICFVCAAVSHA